MVKASINKYGYYRLKIPFYNTDLYAKFQYFDIWQYQYNIPKYNSIEKYLTFVFRAYLFTCINTLKNDGYVIDHTSYIAF